jgi:predicted DsbA family dithiol-disulfide isomerase
VLPRVVEDFDIVMDWRGFELHPSTPPGGLDLRARFGSRLDEMHAHLRGVAEKLGVEMKFPARTPNTRRALAIAELARDQGRLQQWRDAAMDAHWLHGRDIEDDATLRALATDAGLDPDAAIAATADPALRARVAAMGEEAARYGVTGIPSWVFVPGAAGRPGVRVVGCQPYEVLQAACMQAGVERRASV